MYVVQHGACIRYVPLAFHLNLFPIGILSLFKLFHWEKTLQPFRLRRYRRSIDFLVPFKLVTKLVYWDERSLYFEQRFVSLHDGFVRAVALCKNTCVGGTVTVRCLGTRLKCGSWKQCCGSMTFWCGSGSADPCL
jgi:hypothetical protein